jgi:RNA polymerase sigma factor (TIGR02999 family)
MADKAPGDVTSLLREVRQGTPGAADRLMARVYDELRHLAKNRVRGRDAVEPTVLVHEAYIKLFGKADAHYENRHHFFWAAAQAMRDILVDDVRRARAAKRGGGKYAVELGDAAGPDAADDPVDLLALDEAIKRLERVHPKAAQVVILRFFAGLSREETAAGLGMSEAAVWREWQFAKVWLLDAIEGHTGRE